MPGYQLAIGPDERSHHRPLLKPSRSGWVVSRFACRCDDRRAFCIRYHVFLVRCRRHSSRGHYRAYRFQLPGRVTSPICTGCQGFGGTCLRRTCCQRDTSGGRLGGFDRRQGARLDPGCCGNQLDWILRVGSLWQLFHASLRASRPVAVLARPSCRDIMAGGDPRFRGDHLSYGYDTTERHDFWSADLAVPSSLVDRPGDADAARFQQRETRGGRAPIVADGTAKPSRLTVFKSG